MANDAAAVALQLNLSYFYLLELAGSFETAGKRENPLMGSY